MNKKLKELNILYVEDDDFVREETTTLLKMIFKNVYTACDGIDGINEFDSHIEEINIVITDINMPKLTGIEMAKEINKRNNKTPKIPIIAISAYSCDDYARVDLEESFSYYIKKPIQITHLIKCIENALKGITHIDC